MPRNLTVNLVRPLSIAASTPISPFIENIRNKRQLWYGYDYDGYYGYGYYWGRIVLIIIAVIALTICCLVPCICALGIWFAGWFGLRNRASNKTSSSSSPISSTSYAQQQHQQQQPIIPEQPQTTTILPQNSAQSGSASPGERVESYVYEEKRSDHFYHRPPSPRPYDEYRRYYTSSRL